MIRRPPRSTLSSSSAASDVYKRQILHRPHGLTTSGMYSVYSDERELSSNNHTHTTITVPVLSLIHISEPTRLLSISYAVFCLKKKKKINNKQQHTCLDLNQEINLLRC
eukprot:TRINITY_DN23710_c0_g1_i2.p1 TRINITY_DN23710_c0_g1~~TRINITY_DN23710_c0_g1_i2.p1  ORF type:complete len:109 (+),score=23.85 TRINITY_DN23710_c0_g1_i2:139-465(+)